MTEVCDVRSPFELSVPSRLNECIFSKYCQRRPRSGIHRYCSKKCAAEAKPQKRIGRCIPDSTGSCSAHPVRRLVFFNGLQESRHSAPRRDILELLQPPPPGVSRSIYVHVMLTVVNPTAGLLWKGVYIVALSRTSEITFPYVTLVIRI